MMWWTHQRHCNETEMCEPSLANIQRFLLFPNVTNHDMELAHNGIRINCERVFQSESVSGLPQRTVAAAVNVWMWLPGPGPSSQPCQSLCTAHTRSWNHTLEMISRRETHTVRHLIQSHTDTSRTMQCKRIYMIQSALYMEKQLACMLNRKQLHSGAHCWYDWGEDVI